MDRANKTANEGFQKAYNKLPAGEQTSVKEKIKETCDWTNSTFYAKLKGSTPLRKLERAALELIFVSWNIDVWTGEYIKSIE